MKIYYEIDAITDNCKNKCPFESVGVKGESGPYCQVGSITCQECKFCYGHHNPDEYSCLYYNNDFIFTPMPYIKCMYGKDNPWKEKIIQFFYRIKQYLNMTKNEILDEILQNWCFGNEEYIKPAYEELCKTDALVRRKVWHPTYIDKDFIFSSIDSVIKYLRELKKEGFTRIEEEWGEYEHSSITASKYEDENDNEYYSRLRGHLYKIIKAKINVETQNKGKAARIAELKAEIKRLEEV